MQETESIELKRALAEIADALQKIFGELKEINTSLKSVARSQAQQSTVQKRSSS
ncbi:MAG: hypothetical protein ABR577_14750 [Pyrinomonadaceae bacterium]